MVITKMDESIPPHNLEFFDLSNASEEEIKHIRQILYDSRSNGCVELPWEVSLPSYDCSGDGMELCMSEKSIEDANSATRATTIGSVVGQALLYAPPPPAALHAPLMPQSAAPTRLPDVLPAVETFMQQMPPMSTASPIGYPGSYLVPRTLPYLRAYHPHHVGMPLLTCTIPASGELSHHHHMPSHYSPYMSLATPVPAVPHPSLLDNKMTLDNSKDELLQQQQQHHQQAKFIKGPSSSERQYNRRGRKKNNSSNTSSGGSGSSGRYYSSPIFSHNNIDNYHGECGDDPSSVVVSMGSDRIATAVPVSLPLVPVPVPQSTFSGTLPMHSYPPGLHPLTYSQISGPQAPSTPVYYVPVFNHSPYSGYIPSASVIMPVGMPGNTVTHHPTTSESECSGGINESNEDVTKSSDSLAASSESMDGKASPPEMEDNIEAEELGGLTVEVGQMEVTTVTEEEAKKDCVELVSQMDVGSTTLPNSKNDKEEQPAKNITDNLYSESSSCWADLFREKNKSCMNGLDRRPIKAASIVNKSNPEKEMNGKVYNVPNSEL